MIWKLPDQSFEFFKGVENFKVFWWVLAVWGILRFLVVFGGVERFGLFAKFWWLFGLKMLWYFVGFVFSEGFEGLGSLEGFKVVSLVCVFEVN